MKILPSLFLAVLLLAAAPLRPFGDEADNLLGGRLIAQGGVLYVDYWSHHMPLPYQLSAVFAALGAREYLHFRLLYAALVGISGLALYRLLRWLPVMWLWLALAAVAPVVQNSLLTAESLGGYLAVAAWLILYRRHRSGALLVPLLALLMVTATLKLVYLAAVFGVISLWIYRHHSRRALVGWIAPALLAAGYLIVYQNGGALVDQAYRFNAEIYAPYQTTEPVNALTLPVSGALNFVRAVLDMNQHAAPTSLTLLFAAGLFVRRGYQRRGFDSLLLAAVVLLSYPLLETTYTPYLHFTPHYMVLIAAAVVLVAELSERKSRYRLLRPLPALLLSLSLVPGMVWTEFTRVDAPPPYAAAVNALRPASVWIAPASFVDWLRIDAPNAAAPYYFIYPWNWADAEFRQGLMAVLRRNPPEVLVYDRAASIPGIPDWTIPNYAAELDVWIQAHYQEVAPDIYRLK